VSPREHPWPSSLNHWPRRSTPGEDPLGKPLLGAGAQIVGVVADVRGRALWEPPTPAYYVPLSQSTSYRICLVIRSEMGAQQVASDVRRGVREVYPDQLIQRFGTAGSARRPSESLQ
jgi:hypothetical protein